MTPTGPIVRERLPDADDVQSTMCISRVCVLVMVLKSCHCSYCFIPSNKQWRSDSPSPNNLINYDFIIELSKQRNASRHNGGMATKNKTMKGTGRERSSNQGRREHRQSERHDEPNNDDIYDLEQGRHHRHRRSRKDGRGKHSSHQSRAIITMPQDMANVARDSTLELKPPSHHGYDERQNKHGRHNPFMLPSGFKLSPRSDVWLLLSISSLATTSSIAMSSSPDNKTSSETAALILSSLMFTISTVIGFGYRYAPFRESLTCTQNGRFLFKSTNETIVSMTSLAISVIETTIVMNPSLYIAVGGNAIWNANIFFSSWLGLYCHFYLVADLITTNDSSGLVDNSTSPPRGLTYFDSVAKIWWMLLGSTSSIMGVLLHFSNSVCDKAFITSSVCERTFGAAILCAFSLLLNLAALAVYRIALLGEMGMSRMKCFNGAAHAFNMSRRIGAVVSFLVFALQSSVVALVSSPTGPGLEGGSIFLTAWLSFGLSLITVKMYMEAFCLQFTQLPSRKNPRPPTTSKHFDDSFRTFGTVGTYPSDMDVSDKFTDDENQAPVNGSSPQGYSIEQQTMDNQLLAQQEIIQRVPSKLSSSSKTRPKRTNESEKIHGQSFNTKFETSRATNDLSSRTRLSMEPVGVKASFTSKTEPMVFTREQCDVSTMGIETTTTKEPAGLKSGSSYHQGQIRSESSLQTPHRTKLVPNYDGDNIDSSPFMYPISAATASIDEDRAPKQESLKGLQRRASYCSVPSLPVLQEHSTESSSKSTAISSSKKKRQERRHESHRKSATSMHSKSTSKVSKSPRRYKHKFERRGSDGSSTITDPRTIVEDEFMLDQLDNEANLGTPFTGTSEHHGGFSILCDNKSVVTEITTEGFDNDNYTSARRPSHMTRLPSKNPLYNGSNESFASGMPSPRLDVFSNSVDDLVASALRYARKSKLSHNASAKTLSTMSPTPSSSSYLKPEYSPSMSHKRKIGTVNTPKPRGIMKSSTAIAKAKRRKSLESLYSTSHSGEEHDLDVNYAC